METLVEISKYLEMQKKIFMALPLSDFNEGIVEGMNLVRAYINVKMEREGKENAEAMDEKA